jgi:pSer/pThr/pTyr-binding forkhead associated (FHA) protein
MNVVLVMFKDDERRDFPLSEDKTVIGRRQDCHLRIPTKDVSRQHCTLQIENETLTAKDLGSSNGTFVNGKRIAEAELKAGDRLRVGPVTFVVQLNGKPAHIKPEDVVPPSLAEPSVPTDDEKETFDLSDEDFDLEDPLSALDEKDKDEEDDLP